MNVFRRWMKAPKAAAQPLTPAAGNNTPSAANAAPEEPPSMLGELLESLKAMAAASKARERDAIREFVFRNRGAELKQMSAGMGKISAGLRSLSVQSAHGAGQLDPNRLGRILDRMDNLGDATLRQIEGRIGITVSREDRRQLQILRDQMRKWLDARDAHLQEAQLAVDGLNTAASELREELLSRSERLAKAAEIAEAAARTPDFETMRHATPEATAFAATLRAFLDEMRFIS
jgi:hypothetical protein